MRSEPWCRRNWVEEYLASFQSGTLHSGQAPAYHLFLNQRAARLFRELFTRKVLSQWVVTRATWPIVSMDRIPWRSPLREGHNLILSISRKSSTLFL